VAAIAILSYLELAVAQIIFLIAEKKGVLIADLFTPYELRF